MALGGGTFVAQSKVLPGTYINFVSAKSSSPILADRGIATMPLELDWGIDGDVFEITPGDLDKNSLKIFGYDYAHDKLKGLREVCKYIKTLYCYRLTSNGTKAENDFAVAKYSGVRGNDIKIVIKNNVDDPSNYDVITMLGTVVVDTQTVADKTELVSNDFVTFKEGLTLSPNTGVALTNGTNGTVDGSAYQAYLNKIEAYSYNVMGIVTTDDAIKTLCINFCRRLRDDIGAKFQLVLYNKKADYHGVINVKNNVIGELESSLVYYVTGITAGCPINKSNLNKLYDGEFNVNVDFTQSQLIDAISAGEFAFHRVGNDIRVLEDINSQVTVTDDCGDIFKSNQTIRVIDQIANDTAVMFNTKYLGVVPNDDAGRISLWSDIVKYHQTLQNIRAIENFSDKDIVVSRGDAKNSVVVQEAITVVNSMAKLYLTVQVA